MAELVIGVAACAGIYLVGVDPAERQLVRVREQVQTLREEVRAAEATTATVEEAQAALERARGFAAEVSRYSRLAQSETQMIETIAKLGARHGVRIDDLRPANPRTTMKTRPDAKPAPGDRLSAYAFSMVADYASAAALLDDARRELGFVIVQSVKVHPTEGPGEQTVRVTVQTEHRSFDCSALAGATAAVASPPTPPAETPTAAAGPEGDQ